MFLVELGIPSSKYIFMGEPGVFAHLSYQQFYIVYVHYLFENKNTR